MPLVAPLADTVTVVPGKANESGERDVGEADKAALPLAIENAFTLSPEAP